MIRGLSQKKPEKGHNFKSFISTNLKISDKFLLFIYNFSMQDVFRSMHFFQWKIREKVSSLKKNPSRFCNHIITSSIMSSTVWKRCPVMSQSNLNFAGMYVDIRYTDNKCSASIFKLFWCIRETFDEIASWCMITVAAVWLWLLFTLSLSPNKLSTCTSDIALRMTWDF